MGEIQASSSYSNDIREMDSQQLMDFLYEYISKNNFIITRFNSINLKLKENREIYDGELRKLDKKYNDFYYDNLEANGSKARSEVKQKRNEQSALAYKHRRFLNEDKSWLKFRYHMILVYIIFRLATGIRPSFTSGEYAGLLFIVPFISGISYVIIKKLIPYLEESKDLKRIKKAQRKDIESARKKGITKDNIKEVFKYEEIKNELDRSFKELEDKIYSWEADKAKEANHTLEVLASKIPASHRNIENLTYMYDQLAIGANDTWKEAINDLKEHLRYRDVSDKLSQINDSVSQSNERLNEMNTRLNRNIARLDKMVSSELGRIDSRLDGIYNNIDTLYYY